MKDVCNRDGNTSYVSVPSVGSKDLVDKFRQKFIKEAQTIAEMESNHIIKIHDIFEENGTAYYVMEYLSNGTLSDRIPEGGLPESEAVGYIRQIADALSYIHSENILHLDVKPTNILFRKNDEAVLIDFGISKHYDDDGGRQTSSTPVGVSEGYAPTEQYERDGVSSFSASTDIYSLGATLYCLLSGNRPPKASIVLNDGLPSLQSSVSSSVRKAVEQAMSPRRKDRPQSVEEFLALLDLPVEKPVKKPNKKVPVIPKDESTVIVTPVKEIVAESGDVPSSKKGNGWLWAAITGLIVVVAGVLFQLPSEPEDLAADLQRYEELISKGDSLARDVSCLYDARVTYDLATNYENKYSSTKYSSLFIPSAYLKSSDLKSRIDDIRRNEAYYLDGVLSVKGVEYPMVYVDGGTFDMGATAEQASKGDLDEKPVHRVTLSSYRIGMYEVTQELWEAVMGSNPSYLKGARKPVEQVSWDDCQDFIRKLNSLTGQNFRLPTESEWEFAARGGNSSRGYKYSGSNTIGYVAWYGGNSGDTTHNVGTSPRTNSVSMI